jgi:hypothetical protein
VREFYPDSKIIVIDDKSNDKMIISEKIISEGLQYYNSREENLSGSGEIIPYALFYKYKWSERIIVLHDNMLLARPFTNEELSKDIVFHWHCSTHRYDNHEQIQKFLSEINYQLSDKWVSCFGAMSIISLSIVEDLERTHQIWTKLPKLIKSRSDRMTFERIFGIITMKYFGNSLKYSNFGDIFDYPNCFIPNREPDYTYEGAILKTWAGRP